MKLLFYKCIFHMLIWICRSCEGCGCQELWSKLDLRWGWEFLDQTRILSNIQFPRHFIEFVVVEMKQFVSSNVNVILTRQTCGQRSSMAAGSKRWALEFFLTTEFALCS